MSLKKRENDKTSLKTNMALPPSYNTSLDYISDCLAFLKEFSWLYNYHNTYILVKRVLKNFPSDWVGYFEGLPYSSLNQLLEGQIEENCPESLKSLIHTITKLKPCLTIRSEKCDPKLIHNSGLSRKKLHEIISLAPLIDTVCKQNKANIVVDIGAGLGYLSHLLHDNYKHSVLGIECSSQYIDQAYKNQNKFYPNSKDSVKFVKHYIDEKSSDEISDLMQKHFPNVSNKIVCISGLHACADLSITILDLFTKLEFVKCLVIMPCCYHRIKLECTKEGREYFKNFPASKLFKDLFRKFDAETIIQRPFLRLACQQSMQSFKVMSTEEHERHARSCLYRNILQEVVEIENCSVKRLKRKSGKNHHANSENNFQAYLDNIKTTHKLEYDLTTREELDIDDERFQNKMIEKWNEHKHELNLIEVLTGFQACIQNICENIVLLDRVEFLRERGFECTVQKVTDDIISPRCFALVAHKE